jgi:hypothetical protein
VRRLGRLLVVPAVAYLGLLVSTLLGGPTVHSPYLPLPDPPGAAHHPAPVRNHGRGSPSAGPGGAAAGTTTRPVPGTSAAPPRPTAAGSTPAATVPARAHGSSSAHARATASHGSTRTATPPGSTRRATPTRKA